MGIISESAALAWQMIWQADADLVEIVVLSLRVSMLAVLCSLLIGLPLGAWVAVSRFRGKGLILVLMNAMMGLPPVVVGLLVYLHLSRSGPLGWLELLYTPTAMVIAQTLLIAPLVAALSRQVLEDLFQEYHEQFRSMGLTLSQSIRALLWDGRYGLLTVGLAGLGRSLSEVGAVMIVGGNIAHLTRVMTTAIALETSRGELALAMALGFILLLLSLVINGLVMTVRGWSQQASHA